MREMGLRKVINRKIEKIILIGMVMLFALSLSMDLIAYLPDDADFIPVEDDVVEPVIETVNPPVEKQPENRKKIKGPLSGMEFVWIEPGTFMMGSPESEEGRNDDETLHKVTISKGFYMQTTEVTQKQWKTVMGNNPSYFKGDDLPIESVSWDDADRFIKTLNGLEGHEKYRLPTEAQWEYACRAGTTTPFSFGETISTDQANYNGNFVYGHGNEGEYRQKTTPVGIFPPNAWGLYDMHGNVWEWVLDWYGKYGAESVVDPTGPDNGDFRVLRGGSWVNFPDNLRSAGRDRCDPDYRNVYAGFRVASQ